MAAAAKSFLNEVFLPFFTDIWEVKMFILKGKISLKTFCLADAQVHRALDDARMMAAIWMAMEGK